MRRVLLLACLLWSGTIEAALAQAIVLRTDASLAALAPSVVAGAQRRSEREVRIGDALDAIDPRDLGPEVIGVVRASDRIRLFSMAASGALHVTEVGAAGSDRTTARVIVVALAGFVEQLDADVAPVAPEAPRVVEERYALPIDGFALEDLASPVRPVRTDPRFVMELRGRGAYATQRDLAHAEAGLSVGVCFGSWWCVALDADAMAPEEDHALAIGNLAYHTTTVGIGGRFLPLEAGPVRGGIGVDALTRIGHVWTDAPSADDTSVSASVRLMADLSIQLGGPLFLAIEAGADIAFNAVRYLRATHFVLDEDVMTVWGALALRFVAGEES